jgi:hypothetical protein
VLLPLSSAAAWSSCCVRAIRARCWPSAVVIVNCLVTLEFFADAAVAAAVAAAPSPPLRWSQASLKAWCRQRVSRNYLVVAVVAVRPELWRREQYRQRQVVAVAMLVGTAVATAGPGATATAPRTTASTPSTPCTSKAGSGRCSDGDDDGEDDGGELLLFVVAVVVLDSVFFYAGERMTAHGLRPFRIPAACLLLCCFLLLGIAAGGGGVLGAMAAASVGLARRASQSPPRPQ